MLHFFFVNDFVSVDNETKIDVLLNWKASLKNDNQSLLPSWTFLPNNATNASNNKNVSSNPCSWFGISCNHAGSVIRLNLTNLGLKGMLHEFSFSSLPNLSFFDLSMNELFGTFPIDISHQSKLIYLDLSYNNLSGKSPPQIGLLINLVVMHLAKNQLSDSIPLELGHLKSLNDLSLYANHFHGCIPTSLGNLSYLIDFSLDSNLFLCSIPVSLGNLSNLAYFYLYDNQLSDSIPPQIGNLTNLIELDIRKVSSLIILENLKS